MRLLKVNSVKCERIDRTLVNFGGFMTLGLGNESVLVGIVGSEFFDPCASNLYDIGCGERE